MPAIDGHDRPSRADEACLALRRTDPDKAEALCPPLLWTRGQESPPQAAHETPDDLMPPAVPPQDQMTGSPPSDLERFFGSDDASAPAPTRAEPERPLAQFGYELFRQTAASFAPVVDVPVSSDYMIGPGDEFTVTLWGLVDATYAVQVDRNGEITLPRAGVIPVSGVKYDELRPLLEHRLAKYYTDFHLSVAMGRLRSIRVYVVGEAQQPGSYTLSALSTAYNALFAAGGPTKRGSLRAMQVIRGGKTVASIDLYDFLLKGDRSQDIKLQHEDTLLVPLIGPTVGVSGNVVRPAIYEMKGRVTLADVLKLAGGPRPTADLNRVQVERVVAHEKRIATDVDLSRIEDAANIPIENMDVVKLFPIYEVTKDVVKLSGHVVRPGTYQFKPAMRVGDLISSYEQLLPEPSLEYSEIVRYEWPTMVRTVIPFSIRAVMNHDPNANVQLRDRDEIRIYPASRFQDGRFVTINGAVRHPGRYRLYERMTVLELIHEAGDPMPNAFVARAEIRRKVPTDDAGFAQQIVYFRPAQLLAGDEAERKLLEPDDEVIIYAKEDAGVMSQVAVRGQVNKPGAYPLLKDMRVKDLVFQGGLTRESELKEAELIRVSTADDTGHVRRTVVPLDLTRVLAEDPEQNLPLQGDDELLVKQVGELKREFRVTLEGEVRFPGSYAIQAGERMSSLVRRAGGFTDKAYLRGAVFTRQSVRESQQRQLQEFTTSYTQRITAEAASLATGGLSKEETEAAKFQLTTQEDAIKLLASQTPLGRIVIHLAPPTALEGTTDDLILEDGDKLAVPQPPSSVAVIGSVRNPTAIVARDGRSIQDYIGLAGGYLPNADQKSIYVVRVDGSSVSPDQVKTVEAGDAILVPPQVEAKYRPLPFWRDIATIVGQFGIAIAALSVIF